ncbi:MAG: class I SAM-dependent methyltransferase [Candidatus Sulfomarinibacteraceae bacterium]
MVKPYEALMGSLGRAMFFRPERQRVRELLSRDARPKLLIDGAEYPLFDVSMNGLSFLTVNGAREWSIGTTIDLELLMHGESVYHGTAHVARIEPGPRGSRVGVGLMTGFLDLPEIRRRDDQKLLEEQMDMGAAGQFAKVPRAYREKVTEILHFFQYYRRAFDYHERRFRAEGATDSDLLAFAQRAYEALKQPYYDLHREATAAALEFMGDREVLVAAKEYTETVLVPLTLDIPLNHRAYLKPLGYPGDYQVMLYYYNKSFEGDSVFTKVFHRIGIEHPLAHGVCTRKDFIVDLMQAEHDRVLAARGDDCEFRVASLGCGPAREVSDYVARRRTWPGTAIWTLIDQEEEALGIAFRACKREIGEWNTPAQLDLLNLSFVQMINEGVPLHEPESQDYIYCTGLFDYIKDSRAQVLICALYDLLAEGGMMSVGNAVGPQDCFWTPEFLGDWSMIYRTRDQVRRLGDRLPSTARIDVVKEPGEAYYFLNVRKTKAGRCV